ncbi:MAG: GNAT family N-acetyltransferase [Pseudonocardia sp.]
MTVPSDVTIREAVADDAVAIAHLHVDVWEDSYASFMQADVFERRRATIAERIEGWRDQLTDSPVRTTVAEDSSGLVGFASVGPSRALDINVDEELWSLYVRASSWGAGIGHALLTSALTDRAAYLWVLRGNDRAINFYRKHGFVHDGATRSDEYGTEVRMVRRA